MNRPHVHTFTRPHRLNSYALMLSSILHVIPDYLPQEMGMGDCPPNAMFDCAQEIFRQATELWIDRALSTAQTVFVSLALLEIVVTGWVYMTSKKGEGVSDLLEPVYEVNVKPSGDS